MKPLGMTGLEMQQKAQEEKHLLPNQLMGLVNGTRKAERPT